MDALFLGRDWKSPAENPNKNSIKKNLLVSLLPTAREGNVFRRCVTVGAYVAGGGVCGWREMCVVGAKHGWGHIPGVCCPGEGAMLSGGRCAVSGVLSRGRCAVSRVLSRGGVVQGVCCLECEQNDIQV